MTDRCHACDRPLATEADYHATPEGGGAHLCWRNWSGDACVHAPIEWRARALASDARIAALETALREACNWIADRCPDGSLIVDRLRAIADQPTVTAGTPPVE